MRQNKKIIFIKRKVTLYCGYWLSEFHYFQLNSTNSETHKFSQIIDKKLVAAILSICLNLTIIVPVTRANVPSETLKSEIIKSVVSKDIKKNRKQIILYSQKNSTKRIRKNKEKAELISRIELRKKYIFFNDQLKLFKPNFTCLDTTLASSKTNLMKKPWILSGPNSQKKREILYRIQKERLRSLRSVRSGTENNSEAQSSSNISSSVLKKYIAKLVQKLEVITNWIHENPTLFTFAIITNAFLVYLYRDGFFDEWYKVASYSSYNFYQKLQGIDIERYWNEERSKRKPHKGPMLIPANPWKLERSTEYDDNFDLIKLFVKYSDYL